jgi:uncharacterized protein
MRNEVAMSPETAVRVIDALYEGLSEVPKIRVHLYGGEPFINLPAVEAMVKRALEKEPGRFGFVVTTNGTFLSDAIIDLLEAGKFQVIISIDGPAEIHDECRRTVDGSPTHKDVMRFLEAVHSRTSCRIWAASVIRSGWRLAYASDYLSTLPIQAIKAQAVRIAPDAPYALSREELELYKQDLETVGRRVIEELEAGKEPMDKRFAGRVMRLLLKGEGMMRYCDSGRTNFGITPSGKVLACLLVEDSSAELGHINDDPETWKQAGLKWQDRPLRSKCKSCENLQLCGGGCPAVFPICGDDECEIVAKECEVARSIYDHFRDSPEELLGLVGVF